MCRRQCNSMSGHAYPTSFGNNKMLGYQFTAVTVGWTRLTSRHSFQIILWFLLCSSNTLQWNETQQSADFILCVLRRWPCDNKLALGDGEKENDLSMSSPICRRGKAEAPHSPWPLTLHCFSVYFLHEQFMYSWNDFEAL